MTDVVTSVSTHMAEGSPAINEDDLIGTSNDDIGIPRSSNTVEIEVNVENFNNSEDSVSVKNFCDLDEDIILPEGSTRNRIERCRLV